MDNHLHISIQTESKHDCYKNKNIKLELKRRTTRWGKNSKQSKRFSYQQREIEVLHMPGNYFTLTASY